MDGSETGRSGRATGILEIARDTLRLLSERRLPPTPDHYERVWREVAAATGDAELAPPASTSRSWGDLLAQAMRVGVVPQLTHLPDLQDAARALAGEAAVLGASDALLDDLVRFGAKMRAFWTALADANLDADQIRGGLMRILQILVGNISDLLPDDSWLRGQLEVVSAMTGGPMDVAVVAEMEKRLREIAFQQGVLKQSLDQAKDAMRTMIATFVERLAVMSEGTAGYQGRMEAHARRIGEAGSLAELSALVVDIMEDTRSVQGTITRSRDELVAAQRTVHEHEARARQLESELTTLSSRLNEDFLTQQLNRRGLARAFGSESARADRSHKALCVAMLDIDHFKTLNDRLGHAAGDDALVHLAKVVRESIRPSDSLARWGGEEFVILLPDTTPQEAVRTMQRVQRALTRRYFLHNHERVLITFSAGIAQRRSGEAQEAVIERADRALYEAKKAGRNRVRIDVDDLPAAEAAALAEPVPASAAVVTPLVAATPAAHAPARSA